MVLNSIAEFLEMDWNSLRLVNRNFSAVISRSQGCDVFLVPGRKRYTRSLELTYLRMTSAIQPMRDKVHAEKVFRALKAFWLVH